jgi:hypothetical protein
LWDAEAGRGRIKKQIYFFEIHQKSFSASIAGVDDTQLLGRFEASQLTGSVARIDVEYTIRIDQITCTSQIDTPGLTEKFDDILVALAVLGKLQLGEIAMDTSQNRGSMHH